ncbi:hypothetical protein Atai01_63000 [Amycolatopsis taiwanensis]|uniref:DUF6351 domain-containing protein n=2 Tax=Amycolatopsis taiwanensis TaxID=342230 RepID=A0A9W6VKP3_9PSEU|nr:hypothetical protein Atai01_63000 [Amycolatopsis taiwanensis]
MTLMAALAAPLFVPQSASADPGGPIVISSVSNPRPDLVSGGQVLVRVDPSGRSGVRVTANGQDVTSAFHRQPDGSLLGLVTGLHVGSNDITAAPAGHGGSATLKVVDHPGTGPVFSGPQQQPFFCETQAYGLPPAQQPLCSAPTQVSYQYRTTAGTFAALADPAARPADLATATVGGRKVPYIVRIERGTIDRAVYEIAALHDGSAPSPFTPDSSWNQKLVYTFGGGCNAGYHQGATTGGVLNDLFLSQGYAVASSSLNVLDNNCSPIISAEAAMMVKEHFVETYGPVLHTIGWGGSGGAIQQYDIAESYPGIVDGIIPGISFPDPLTTGGPVSDCRLLNRYFAGPGASFTPAQRLAVSGYHDYGTCISWDATFASRATATDSCNAAIPVSARWDPVTNPGGVKCNSNEQLVNQLGRDPQTGFVRSPLDSTGIQYGLQALKDGQITPAQFVDLNAGIGGLDYTGKPVPQRSAADPVALAASYADDILNSASEGLRTTPIIDQRTDLDLAGFGNDIHTSEWSFTMRQRLLDANGTAGNQVIIENAPAQAGLASAYELDAMDRWLTAIEADTSHRPLSAKVLAHRPADLADGCYLPSGQRVQQPLTVPSSGQCGALYPVAANPRLVAGENLAMDVLKCRLKPLNFHDYPVTFTDEEKQRLAATFANGVCDYGKRGVGARKPLGTWRSYGG